MPMTPMTPSNEVGAGGNNDQQMLMAFLSQFSGVYSGSAIGSLAIIGVVSSKSEYILYNENLQYLAKCFKV